jgi:hypothetical protein
MSTEQFNVMRKELVENVTGAALDWLAYMGAPAALAAIPDIEPPRYVVAGTLANIVKLLPAAEVIRPSASTEWNDRELSLLLFAVRRFVNHAYQAANEAAQDKRSKAGTAGRLLDDAKDAGALAVKLQRLRSTQAAPIAAAPAAEEVQTEEWSYSTDEERYHEQEPSRLAILRHAVGELEGQGEDSSFWIGRNVGFTGKGDPDSIIEALQEQAFEECGEFAETYLDDVTQPEKNELQTLVTEWAKRVDRSNFWTVRDTEFFTIAAARAEIERIDRAMKRAASTEGEARDA